MSEIDSDIETELWAGLHTGYDHGWPKENTCLFARGFMVAPDHVFMGLNDIHC